MFEINYLNKIKAKHKLTSLYVIYYKACRKMLSIFVRKIQTLLFNKCGKLYCRRNNKTFSIKMFSLSKHSNDKR